MTQPRVATRLALLASLALAVLHPARARAGAATLPTDFSDSSMASSLDLPTSLAEVPDPPGPAARRVLFVEQYTGRIGVIAGASVFTVGTVAGISTDDTERGLLGVAVDPGWPARPYLYVHCTDARSGHTIAVSRYTVSGDLAYTNDGLLQIDANSRYDLRADFPDNQGNHNGGSVRFGPDGMLYVSLGDDASGCPAQNLTVAAGKILRLDVQGLPPSGSGPAPYALIAPADNPFATNADSVAQLVWAFGLRNPFRINPDPVTGAVVIGDVGLDSWEEMDLAPAGGMDFGWPMYEGPDAYANCPGSPAAPLTGPIADYPHPLGEAIVGGPMYRQPAMPTPRFPDEYDGNIFFSDYYSGLMRRLAWTGSAWAPAPAPGQPDPDDWGTGLDHVSDLIEVSDGSLWYCRQYQAGAQTGEVRRITYVGSVGLPPPAQQPLALDPPHPNPARGITRIGWWQPGAGTVTIGVYEPGGRRVRTLLEHAGYAAGPHAVDWDARDDDGHRVPAGLYFLRLEQGGEHRSVRLALLP